MSGFADWTLDEQKRFWLALAQDAILQWGLDDPRLYWLGYSSNAVFKVEARSANYVLRLHLPGRVRAKYLESELCWLRSIQQNTELLAPAPVPLPADGIEVLFVSVRHAQFAPDLVHCSLFEFHEGENKPAAKLTVNDIYAIGAYLGTLHRSGTFRLPEGFSRPRMDWEGLLGAESPYVARNSSLALTGEQTVVFEKVANRVRETMDAIERRSDTFGLIHGDLLAKNILISDDGPAALDFEYCGWGYFLYDLAPLLWQLKGERPADYRETEDAMWSGYMAKAISAVHERAHLEVFIAARQLASCRWLLANADHPTVREIAPPLLDERFLELSDYLEHGILHRNSPTL